MISYSIPASITDEISALETLIAAHRAGSVSDAQLKAHRVPFGVYEQRVRGAYMVRVRTPGGMITPAQLAAVAQIAADQASGIVHLTTRQELQIHDVPLERIVPVIRALLPHGLSSRGGGGNTVRNIMASWDAGISPTEEFDVTPYVVALTSRLISESDSWVLPRKFKIAFSNSAADNAFATINDLGFVAVMNGGRRGFRVYVAGGMGRQPQPGHLLHDWIDGNDVLAVTEAVKRVFDKHGNRKNRHSARLRFLWNSVGRERFLELYTQEREIFAKEGHPPLVVSEIVSPAAASGAKPETATPPQGFEVWRNRFVRGQRQPGLYSVSVPVLFGVADSRTLAAIALALDPLGDDVIRLSVQQNIAVRNVGESHLVPLYQTFKALTPLSDSPALLGNTVACAGATTCQLGLCRSRDALKAVIDHLTTTGLNLDEVSDVKVHISGCSNTCGQHLAADLGFFGKTGTAQGHGYPVYGVVAGAVIADGTTRLASRLGDVPARVLPVVVEQIMSEYIKVKGQYKSFPDFIEGSGTETIKRIIEAHNVHPLFENAPAFFTDWGADTPFSTAGRGTGECASGLFDMIDLDRNHLKALRAAVNSGDGSAIKAMVITAAHTLLVAKGLSADNDRQTLESFEKEFIGEGLIDAGFTALLHHALADATSLSPSYASEALRLADAVEALYATLDDSLRFKPPAAAPAVKIDVEKDLRGVACPMNFVKTKLALAGMTAGQKLAVLLDDGEPIVNVPGSVAQEGHLILEKQQLGTAWRVVIERAK